jgi:cardiolipin synthase
MQPIQSDGPRASKAAYTREWLERLIGVGATEGNQIDVLLNGEEIFPAMLSSIDAAQVSVDLASFNFGGWIGSEFATALAARAKAGLEVRVLLDSIGARRIDPGITRILGGAGVELQWFRPPQAKFWQSLRRGHRKILVCDGRVGFTGGVGIDDRWHLEGGTRLTRRDTHFRLLGPAVQGLAAAFCADWSEARREPIPSSVGLPLRGRGTSIVQVIRSGRTGEPGSLGRFLRALILAANQRLRISTAYFVPDNVTLDALCEAARNGVVVDLLVNGRHRDKWFTHLASQSTYHEILKAGVRVWEYERSMLHSKVVIVDDALASVGSANFNGRSLFHDEELNLTILDRRVVSRLNTQFDLDVNASRRLRPDAWSARSPLRRPAEQVASLLQRYL